MSYKAEREDLPEFLKTNPGPPKRDDAGSKPPPIPRNSDNSAHQPVRNEFERAVSLLREAADGDDEDAKKARRALAVLDREQERKTAMAAAMGLLERQSEVVHTPCRVQLGTYTSK